ncbi:thioredoxin [bacterium]|nr:thioredoxin [bacterium]
MSEILNDTNFDNFLKENENVVVDFFAEWCGPCKMLGPIMDELSEEYKDQNIKIVKVDVDQAKSLAQRFNVMSIPTVIFFKKGEAQDTIMGLLPKNSLKEKIDALIK